MNCLLPLKRESKTVDMSGTKSFSTDNKVFLRENWNKPLLKFLAKKNGEKLVYMGLPSPSGEDITNWIEFIKVVIAFQCREYGKQSDPSQSRDDVEKLHQLLNAFERERKLDNFLVYDGYMEEVVLRGYDNSPQRITLGSTPFITLYNLDFCNDIASPLEYVDEIGEVKTAYKFDAVKKLLTIQNSISKVSNKFIFLLTVHCSYDGKELTDFLSSPPSSMSPYLKKYFTLSGVEKNARIVRLFVCHLIHQTFPANDFNPKILPVIRYNGIGGTPLLHFVVMGCHSTSVAGATPIIQQFEEVINQRFVDIDSNTFVNSDGMIEEELAVNINPIEFFTQSNTYNKLWK